MLTAWSAFIASSAEREAVHASNASPLSADVSAARSPSSRQATAIRRSSPAEGYTPCGDICGSLLPLAPWFVRQIVPQERRRQQVDGGVPSARRRCTDQARLGPARPAPPWRSAARHSRCRPNGPAGARSGHLQSGVKPANAAARLPNPANSANGPSYPIKHDDIMIRRGLILRSVSQVKSQPRIARGVKNSVATSAQRTRSRISSRPCGMNRSTVIIRLPAFMWNIDEPSDWVALSLMSGCKVRTVSVNEFPPDRLAADGDSPRHSAVCSPNSGAARLYPIGVSEKRANGSGNFSVCPLRSTLHQYERAARCSFSSRSSIVDTGTSSKRRSCAASNSSTLVLSRRVPR